MAKAKIEKEAPEQGTGAAPAAKGKMGTILMMVASGGLLMMAGAGVTFFLLKGQIGALVPGQGLAAGAEGQAAAAAQEVAPAEGSGNFLGALYEMEPLIVNLERSKGKRYLKVKMSFELNKETVLPEVEARMPQIRDAILLMISGKAFSDVSTVEGKLALRDALVTRVNGLLETGFVKRIYFQEFVVQ
jgi:flagellar FliL protein